MKRYKPGERRPWGLCLTKGGRVDPWDGVAVILPVWAWFGTDYDVQWDRMRPGLWAMVVQASVERLGYCGRWGLGLRFMWGPRLLRELV